MPVEKPIGLFFEHQLDQVLEVASKLKLATDNSGQLRQALKQRMVQVSGPIEKLMQFSRMIKTDQGIEVLEAYIGHLISTTKIPKRPDDFHLMPGKTSFPGDDMPRPDLPANRSKCVIPPLKIARMQFNILNHYNQTFKGNATKLQDRLWDVWYVMDKAIDGLALPHELIVQAGRVQAEPGLGIGPFVKHFDAFRERPFEQPPIEMPIPNGERPSFELDFCKAEAQNGFLDFWNSVCTSQRATVTGFRNLSKATVVTLEQPLEVCEYDVIQIDIATRGSPLEFAALELPFFQIGDETLNLPSPPMDVAGLLNGNFRLIQSEFVSNLRIEVSPSNLWQGEPALTDRYIRFAIPNTWLHDPRSRLEGLISGRQTAVLQLPCTTRGSPNTSPTAFPIVIRVPPRIFSIEAPKSIYACEPVTLEVNGQDLDRVSVRREGEDTTWYPLSKRPGVVDSEQSRFFGTIMPDPWFSDFPRQIRIEVSGGGFCGNAPSLIRDFLVRYRLSVIEAPQNVGLEQQAKIRVSLPDCVRAPVGGVTLTLAQEDGLHGLVDIPTQVTIPFGEKEVTFLVIGLETGGVQIVISGESIDPAIVTLNVIYNIAPPDPQARSMGCHSSPTVFPPPPSNWQNWHGNHYRDHLGTFRPANLDELVSAVWTADNSEAMVGVAGTSWSFTDCVVSAPTGVLIRTEALNVVLGRGSAVFNRVARYGDNVETGRPSLQLTNVVRRNERHKECLVHVEAGMKLHDVNCTLWDLGLSMPTLGGSYGQSIGGVMSTGVHGSHVQQAPVADVIEAIHVVGAGGQEWWIERASSSITNPAKMAQARANGQLCPGIEIVYDDDLFNSCLVSFGCFGVIYAVVVRARPKYFLDKTTERMSLGSAMEIVRDRIVHTPAEYWCEIIVHTVTRECTVTRMHEVPEPVAISAATPVSGNRDLAQALAIAAAIVGAPGGGLVAGVAVGTAVAVAPIALTTVLAVVSTMIAALVGEMLAWVAIESGEIAGLFAIPFGFGIPEALRRIETDIRPIQNLISLITDIPGRLDRERRRIESEGGDFNAGEALLAEELPNLVNILWQVSPISQWAARLITVMQTELIKTTRPQGTFFGLKSYTALCGQNNCEPAPKHPPTERLVESFEYAVPAERAEAFLNALLVICEAATSNRDNAIVVSISVRFTGLTKALLAMQKYPVGISGRGVIAMFEVYTFSEFQGNPAFHQALYGVVRTFQAIPHWGQFHDPATNFTALYGSDLTRWQQSLIRVSTVMGLTRQTFWNGFARARSLLPF